MHTQVSSPVPRHHGMASNVAVEEKCDCGAVVESPGVERWSGLGVRQATDRILGVEMHMQVASAASHEHWRMQVMSAGFDRRM